MADHLNLNLANYVRAVHDFPKPGILFRDISPMLASTAAMETAVERIRVRWVHEVDCVVGLDARGFIFGALVAQALRVPFVMARKKGKLPGETLSVSYNLEYGTAELEVQVGAITLGANVLIVDDLLATGGSASAAAELIRKAGGDVAGAAFIIELEGLGGRQKLGKKIPVQSLVFYLY